MRILILCTALSLLFGCATDRSKPDLARLYAQQSGETAPPPLIVIHGVLGGRLADINTGVEVWPGSVRRVLFDDYRELRLDINPQTLWPQPSPLQVTGITDRAAGRDFYGAILDTLDDVGGYQRSQVGQSASMGERRYYVYAYDWRQDNLQAARGLHALIQQIRVDYNKPDLKVDIVAHSMGGLITRYFMRFGTEDVMNDNRLELNYMGVDMVRRVILLGTPNLGSIAGLELLLYGKKVVVDRIEPEVIASFPSAYQVLPHALRDRLIDRHGQTIKSDIFDVNWWRDNQLSIFNPATRERIIKEYPVLADGEAAFALLERYFERHLERGRRFSWSLTVPAPWIVERYVVFGGSCKPTPARGLLQVVDGRTTIVFEPGKVADPVDGVDYRALMWEPGDGTVTKASLLARHVLDPTVARHRYSYFALDYAIFLCEDHVRLTGNPSFQDNLLNALLSADL